MSRFTLPLRVYIEDTDAGGIVYYVNYFKYMERARTEFLRSIGFGKSFIFNEELMFVVKALQSHYHAPAVLDDELSASATPVAIGGASLTLEQGIYRGDELIVAAEVQIVCVDRASKKPKRIPKTMISRLRECQSL